MVTPESKKKNRDGKGKRRYSSSDLDSSSDDKESWRSGMTGAK